MSTVYTQLSSYTMAAYQKDIADVLKNLVGLSPLDRLHAASAAWLAKPYLLGACGEGEYSEFDQSPLYRSDGFDCVTYVNMVLALCISNDIEGFEQAALALNYYKSNPSYLTRFHFASADWNVQNAMLGVIEDVTYTIVCSDGESIAKTATTLIDKPNWLRFRSLEDIKLLESIDEAEAQKRLDHMHQQAAFYQVVETETPYIALSDLFDGQQCNEAILQQIPQGCVLEIVRPNWNLAEQIGTCLNVSHLGFALKKDGEWVYRQASAIHQQVEDVPLVAYLRNCCQSPTIAGFSLQLPAFL